MCSISCIQLSLPYNKSQENKRLSEPLTVALTDVAELHAHLRGQEKDRMSLANAKARLRVIDEQVSTVAIPTIDFVIWKVSFLQRIP